MSASTKADEKGLGSLKGHVYTAAMGAQADDYTKTTKAIAEYVGRVYGNEMRQLVLNGKESTPTELAYPDGTSATDKDKAIWSKRCDLFLKQEAQHTDHKAKVFTIVFGQCDKAMKNRVEAAASCSTVESKTDVAKLLQVIKGVAFDANEKKHQTQQATKALQGLLAAGQQEIGRAHV